MAKVGNCNDHCHLVGGAGGQEPAGTCACPAPWKLCPWNPPGKAVTGSDPAESGEDSMFDFVPLSTSVPAIAS